MNCFFLIYAVAGWMVDGRDKLNWSLEAPTVGLWVFLGMVIYSVLVLAYVRLRGGSWRHPLSISSFFHIILAVLLMVSIFVAIKQ